jgi:hypothetical protein
MVQYANYAGLLTSLPTVEEVLDDRLSFFIVLRLS